MQQIWILIKFCNLCVLILAATLGKWKIFQKLHTPTKDGFEHSLVCLMHSIRWQALGGVKEEVIHPEELETIWNNMKQYAIILYIHEPTWTQHPPAMWQHEHTRGNGLHLHITGSHSSSLESSMWPLFHHRIPKVTPHRPFPCGCAWSYAEHVDSYSTHVSSYVFICFLEISGPAHPPHRPPPPPPQTHLIAIRPSIVLATPRLLVNSSHCLMSHMLQQRCPSSGQQCRIDQASRQHWKHKGNTTFLTLPSEQRMVTGLQKQQEFMTYCFVWIHMTQHCFIWNNHDSSRFILVSYESRPLRTLALKLKGFICTQYETIWTNKEHGIYVWTIWNQYEPIWTQHETTKRCNNAPPINRKNKENTEIYS